MKLFKFVWRDGKEETGFGNDVADALTKLGYGAGAVSALDYHKDITDTSKGDLDNYKCPQCGPVNQIGILINTWVNAGILDSGEVGAELQGDTEWCGFDQAQCIKCGKMGLVKDFEQ